MRQVQITRIGPPEVLALRELPDPRPGPGEVRIRVSAIGVNFADLMLRLGLYPDGPRLPAVPGYEIAGVVDAIGDGASGPTLGEDVVAATRFGGYSDTVCVPSRQAYRLPPGISPEIGAALPVNYLTAYQMLVVMSRVRAGDTVLIHGAAGGVGLAAVDICRLSGARILGSASPSKHAFLRERGVEHLFSSEQKQYAAAVKAATGGHGADIVLEPRSGRWIMESYRSLAKTGQLILFGFASAAAGRRRSRWALLKALAQIPWLRLNPLRLMNDNKSIAGVNLARMWDRQDKFTEWMHTLLEWLAAGRVSPRVDCVFALADAAAAHHYLHDRRNIGKVILRPEADTDSQGGGS